MIPYIETPYGVTFHGKNGIPQQVHKNHPNFNKIIDIVKGDDSSDEVFDVLVRLMKPIETIRDIAKTCDTLLRMTSNGRLYCVVDDYEVSLPHNLATYVLKMQEENNDLTPIANFIAKLVRNPRKEVVDELWGFISACGMCLTPQGNFLAYKNVRNDFKSIHDNRFDNSPGKVLKMPRSAVEHDPQRTCAQGLHFAAWGYLSHYSDVNGKTVLLSISPEDVVSIPADYNNMKGRACRYKVLREVDRPEELKNTILFDEDDADWNEDWDEDEF